MTALWHSAQIHSHDPTSTDALILDAVGPLLSSLPASVEGAYFTRHWLRGPHVRVQVKATADVWNNEVKPLIESAAGRYLREHPSAGHPSPEQERLTHAKLAELEEEPGPLEPWHPDHTVQYEPYDRRLHVLGTEEASELLAGFHAATTELALAILADMRGGEQLQRIALDLMFASAQTGCPPISRGFISYRSHTEGFLANCSDPRGMRERFGQVYATNRERTAAALDSVLRALGSADGIGTEVAYLAEWTGIIRGHLARISELRAAGLLPLPEITAPDQPAASTSPFKISEFHQALYGNAVVRRELAGAAWFADYRVLLNHQYLFFSRLGLTPVDRFLLCYLAARTVEDANGMSLADMKGLLDDATASGRVRA